jgi:16S rRNA (adenine1518-N6/adenine1519-N6)-dimethyltransferase
VPAERSLPPLREVIARHGLSARKSLGQNFLLDLNLTARIARAAGDLHGVVAFEVGPGPGGLTRALLDAGAAEVIAVERDQRAVAALAELAQAYPGRLQIVAGDALSIDEAALLAGRPARLVANLPYNIATALLLKWLRQPKLFESYTLMFQKEVALRLAASPGSKDYGRLSVAVQWRAAVRCLFDIPPRAFTPPPKVTSTLVRLQPRPEPLAPADPLVLERVLAAAFGQRRKMLRASLRQLGPAPEPVLEAAGLRASARAEDLSVEQFAALARAYAALPQSG